MRGTPRPLAGFDGSIGQESAPSYSTNFANRNRRAYRLVPVHGTLTWTRASGNLGIDGSTHTDFFIASIS